MENYYFLGLLLKKQAPLIDDLERREKKK